MFGKCIGLFLIPILLYNIEAKPKEIKCPDYCTCDVYQTYRRAVCRNRKLYSIEIGMPSEAEILDISYNQISELGNNIFLEIGLTNLKLLNVSHNKLSHIHLNGFEGLSRLKTLDISFNMLRYFLEQWFVSLTTLEELYLRGNNLASINEEPPLTLKKLRILDISLCAIESLHPGIFQNLPNMMYLDVSDNYLTYLKPEVFKGLFQLKTIHVKGNPAKCKDLYKLKAYANANGIHYDDPCKKLGKKNKNLKFERIISLVPQTPEKNGWLYDHQEEIKTEIKIIEVCNEKSNRTNNFHWNKFETFLLEIITLSPLLFIMFTLVFGITAGIIIGCSCNMRGRLTYIDDDLPPNGPPPYRRRDRNSVAIRNIITTLQGDNSTTSEFRPRTRSTGSRRLWREDRNLLLMNEYNLSDSTPVLTRKNTII